MIGARKIFNASRDLITLFSGASCRPWARTRYVKLHTKFDVSLSVKEA